MYRLKKVLLLAALALPFTQYTVGGQKMIFPGKNWMHAKPDSQGVDPGKLKAAVKYLEQHSGSNGVLRLVIIRNGFMIWRGPEANKRQGVWSVTKAFTSTAQGLLIQDGKCTLNTLAKNYNPRDLAKFYPTVTLRHFATMTSGYDGVGGSYDFAPHHRGDQNAFVRPMPPFFKPGTKFAKIKSHFKGLITFERPSL